MGESINFDKLQQEFDKAVASDAKYSRENDAKFRAIHQKVATYEEFEDIVKASHLRPLNKTDRLSEVRRLPTPWNALCSDNEISSKPTTDEQSCMLDNTKKILPKDGQELAVNFKRLSGDEEKYHYITMIGSDHMKLCFKTEKYSTTEEEKLSFLETLSKAGRFCLSLAFLSCAERNACRALLDSIESENFQHRSQQLHSTYKL